MDMDEKLEILLNSTRNVDSVDVDSFNKIELSNNVKDITEYDIRNVLSVTELFDIEREFNEVYRIYGKIEYMSLLNGLKLNYSLFQELFTPQLEDSKNIFNSFDFYLVKPSTTGYTQITTNPTRYVRHFDIIATPNDFEIYKAGFANNVFDEQTYGFSFNKDFDISGILDNFRFPLTELFLYARYKPRETSPPETLRYTNWGTTGIPISPNPLIEPIVDNKVYGDLIEYSRFDFFQQQISPQTYYIATPLKKTVSSPLVYPVWKYNPFIPLRLRYFEEEPTRANTGDTSYEETSKIPYYATDLNNGNFVWREILPQGIIDPLSGIGVDYPFVNKRRYLFSTLVLDIIPDFNNPTTYDLFKEIWFENNTIRINARPIGNINNIGKPCL